MTEQNTPRTDLLNEAMSLINGDRNKDYGDPTDDFAMTARLWEVYLRRAMEARGLEEIFLDPHDVAALMMLLKISRLSWTPSKRDHWADVVGYSACGWECVERTYNDGL